MKGVQNLDDVNKTVFCIPYNPTSSTEDDRVQSTLLPKTPYDERDLEDGQELRFVAYKAAWKKCLARMQETIDQLQKTVVGSVVQEVRTSYLNVLPGLPYPELPVVSVTNPSLGAAFLNNITTQLEEDDIPDYSQSAACSVVHLYPGDIPNLSMGMRSIISSFVDKAKMLERVKRKPTTSLASYDIKYLVAWYKAWVKSLDSTDGHRPNLVAVLHDFEQFDPLIMQHIFYICSAHISELPLVFLLSMSSPSSDYLNIAYPRATLSLLRHRGFSTPSGRKILQEILQKTFFDVEFEPDIMIGPAVIDYLNDYFTRYHSSVDAILTIVQLTHLKHFTSDPLALLVHVTPSTDILSHANSSGFSDSLVARVYAEMDEDADRHDQGSRLHSLINTVNEARVKFYTSAKNLRIGFAIMILIQSFLEKQGYKGLDWSADIEKKGRLVNAMSDSLKGDLDKDIKRLLMYTRKLNRDDLDGVLESLYQFFNNLSAHLRSKFQDMRTPIVTMRQLLQEGADEHPEAYREASAQFNEWLATYLGQNLAPLENCTLWDVWYTGLSPFPAEILNPSIRASVTAGLLRPHEFADDLGGKIDSDPDSKPIWELPDTSILFKRYLDSGKMINVYDWFESFKSVLDDQRTHLKEIALQPQTPSPQKRGRGKAKAKQRLVEAMEEDEEKWSAEVQARFIRALHELDYLGFIKHTGRKADHVLRTVFDIADTD